MDIFEIKYNNSIVVIMEQMLAHSKLTSDSVIILSGMILLMPEQSGGAVERAVVLIRLEANKRS